jgi:hypothetical protein
MQIIQAHVALTASHVQRETVQRTEHVEAWIDAPARRPAVAIELSEPARQALEAAEVADGEDASLPNGDPNLAAAILLIEMFTGKRVRFLRPEDLERDPSMREDLARLDAARRAPEPGADREGWGLRIDVHEVRERLERSEFEAKARIATEDGRTIDIDLRQIQERLQRHEEHVSVRAGDALKDPIVVDLGLAGTTVAAEPKSVDLDGDGTGEALPHLGESSPFLVHDRDGDGVVDDGSELFGPTTGDGYAELRALDDDGNQFLDAGDAAWDRLALWIGDDLVGLTDAGIGALYLGDVSAPFELLDAAGDRRAQQQAMSFWVGEDGSSGTTRRIDVAV